MCRVIYSNIIILLASILLPAAGHAYDLSYNIGKIPGAKIVSSSCDPTQYATDATSCLKLGIDRDKFTIKIRFDPQEPSGLPPKTIIIPGLPTKPASYTINPSTSAVIFNLNSCGSTPNCYNIAEVYKSDGTKVIIDPNSTQFNEPSIVGGAITFYSTNNSAYTAPTIITNPATGYVKTVVSDSAGDPLKTTKKYIGSSNNYNDTNDPIDPASSLCTNNPAHCVDGTLSVAQVKQLYSATCRDVSGVYTKVATGTTGSDIVSCPAGTVVSNLRAVQGDGGTFKVNAGTQSCTIGAPQSYQANKPVMTADCEVVYDINRCGTPASPANQNTTCDYPVIGGKPMHKEDGSVSMSLGNVVMAVAGPSSTRQIQGTLFNYVFPTVLDSDIDNFDAQDININAQSDVYLKTRFEMRYEGSLACVYAYGPDPSKEWRVAKEFPASLNDVYDLPSTAAPMDANAQPSVRRQDALSLVDNCFPAPNPKIEYSMPTWNNMVSKVCTDYETSSSNFRWPNGTNRAFIGIVVECIEQTLLTIFYPTTVSDNAQPTFFSNMQNKLMGALRGVLALYIIFFGYKLVTGKSVPKRNEWMWVFMRIVLVTYFAMGVGMVDLLPRMLDISKNLSLVVMNAGLGASLQDAQFSCAKAADKAACEAAIIKDASGSYEYCDFRDKVKFPYPAGKEYMQLWDVIDCKVSKYLGIGDNYDYPGAPQVLFVGVVSVISVGLGIPIFIFSLVFLSVIIMLTVRAVHIYLMAFMGLVMLVFISPIVIPAILFETTKPIFTQWITQVLAFWLQPIILFGFLSFMLIVMDGVMFGGNRAFNTPGPSSPSMKLVNDNGIIHGDLTGHLLKSEAWEMFGYTLIPGGDGTHPTWTQGNIACEGSDTKCRDKNSLGYQLQAAAFNQTLWPSSVVSVINIWTVSFEDGGTRMLLALCQMVLICLISYFLLSSVENISARLVSAMGVSGAASFSAAPVVGPQSMLQGGMKTLQGINQVANRFSMLRKANRNAVYDVGKGGYKAVKAVANSPWKLASSISSAASSAKTGMKGAKETVFGKSTEEKKVGKEQRDAAINAKASYAQKAMNSGKYEQRDKEEMKIAERIKNQPNRAALVDPQVKPLEAISGTPAKRTELPKVTNVGGSVPGALPTGGEASTIKRDGIKPPTNDGNS